MSRDHSDVRRHAAAKLAQARQLRRDQTPAERQAWKLLRGRRMLGLKFRRQQVIGRFVVDFYCPALRLVIELDGAPHDEPQRTGYDTARSEWLQVCGYKVVRLRNRDVSRRRLEEVLRPFLVPPLPKGEGDRG